jgi:ergothioneine biosynthesis protein EgtB
MDLERAEGGDREGAEDEHPPSPALVDRYEEVRRASEALCEPLALEDYGVQSMPDASPVKWHLAHTTWYFETFVLAPLPGHAPFHPAFEFLFNSYYNSVGSQYPRPQRGLLTRPTVEEVRAYRRHVDGRMLEFLSRPGARWGELAPIVELGLHHEQQHQELILTDLKHAFAQNPLRPAYRPAVARTRRPAPAREWIAFPEALRRIGQEGKGFCFDNERPRHPVWVPAFELASRPVTCGEYLAFLEADGYARPELWLSDGWSAAHRGGWRAPLYWERRDGEWWLLTLNGMERLDPDAPVCHVSYYEADAYARFAGARLPTEQEWETAAAGTPVEGNFVESGRWHPEAARCDTRAVALQLFGDVWEWTASAYAPYPGYRPPSGAIGEYNGKFMCNQLVLRGGSCVTPADHVRASYRNFFYPDARWQFAGVRLARDA